MQRRFLPLFAAPLALVAACGLGEESATPAPPPPSSASKAKKPTSNELAALLPTDAVAYLEFASLQEVDALLQEAAAIAEDPMMSAMARTDALLPMALGGAGKIELLDRSKPLGLSVSLKADEPAPVFYLPCLNASDFAASLGSLPGGPAVKVEGNYVVVAPAGDYRKGGSPHALASGLLDAAVAMRINVAGVSEAVRPLAAMGLGQARGMAQAQGAAPSDLAALERAEESLDSFWNSADTFDLGLSLKQGKVDLSFGLAAKEGSQLASWASQGKTQVDRLARFFTGDEAFQILVGTDSAFFSERIEPLFAELAAQDESAQAVLPIFAAVRRSLGSTFALTADFEEGIEVAMYCKPRDEAAFYEFLQAGLDSLDEGAPYMELASTTNTVGDLTVHEYTFNTPIDPEGLDAMRLAAQDGQITQLFGEDGMCLRVVGNGEHMALVLGGSEEEFRDTLDTLSDAGAGFQLTGPLADAFGFVGNANPSFVANLDLARLALQSQELIDGMTEMKLGVSGNESGGLVPSAIEFDRPVPMTYYGAIEGRQWRFGMTLDLAGLVEMAKTFGSLASF